MASLIGFNCICKYPPVKRRSDCDAENSDWSSKRASAKASSIDLTNDLELRPGARQLKRSLLDYMVRDTFAPSVELQPQQVESMLRPLSPMQKVGARVISTDSEEAGCEAANVIDGNTNTIWHTAWNGSAPGLPHELVIELASPTTIRGCKLLPRQDGNRNGWIKQFSIDLSNDGQTWNRHATADLEPTAEAKQILIDQATEARFIKLTVTKVFTDQPYASLAELELLIGGD